MDEASDVEERALRELAGYLEAKRRLERWRWDEPEMPPVDAFYRRCLSITTPPRDAS